MTWGLEGVSVRFGHVVALDGVSLAVEPGEIAVVVGGDGAGKTTLCRTLVGLNPVSAGSVSRPERTGFQPETSGVWADLTVTENLEFVAGAYQLDHDHAVERMNRLIEATALGEARDRLGRQLSGGMRQKLGVAMAVMSEPDLLVLDEPTTGLDPISRIELWSFISMSAREGRSVVLTTAYVDEAARAGTVLALDDGAVLAEGSVGSIVESLPGDLYISSRPATTNSWRRGRSWRVWSPDGANPGNLPEADTDLADVITVAAMARESAR